VLVIKEAGTGAVSWTLLTSVVTSCVCFGAGPTFHRMSAPVTKRAPLTVIVKPDPPAIAVLGLKNATEEVDVWIVRLVLYWEHADASPHATNATTSHLFRRAPLPLSGQASRARTFFRQAPSRACTRREHIRTRSSRATRRDARQTKAF